MRLSTCLALALAASALVAAAPKPAEACTWPMPTTFEPDPDSDPNGTPLRQPAAVARTSAYSSGGCTEGECSGQPLLYIMIETEDGVTSIDDIGFEITPRDGARPLPFEGPVRAYYIDGDGYAVIYVPFDDTVSNLGSLEIVAIDRAGNRSESTIVPIQRERDGGCQAASGVTSSWLWILLAILAVMRRDRAKACERGDQLGCPA
jgi:uncharacterized protein (TIGR03382 family)